MAMTIKTRIPNSTGAMIGQINSPATVNLKAVSSLLPGFRRR